MTLSRPPPRARHAVDADGAVLWVAGVSLASIAGGAWMGFSTEAAGQTAGAGAFLMMLALILAIAVAQKAGIVVGMAILGQRGWQRLRQAGPTTPAARAGRAYRDDRRLRWSMAAAGACALLVLAPVAALVVWMLAADASLIGAIGRSLLVALPLAIALPRALPALDAVRFGGAPPV